MNFYKFTIPTQLNGEQLKAELGCDEVYIRGDALVIGGELTEEQASLGVKNHVPVSDPELTIAQKLESIGLTITDLKTALGL